MKHLFALLLLAGVITPRPGFALPKEQVTERLNVIPVFAVVSEEGRPLVAKVKDKDQEIGVIPIFSDPKAAQSNYEEFKKTAPPEIKEKYRLIVLSLGNAVEAARIEGQNKESKIRYTFQPSTKAQQEALALIKKVAPDLKQFPGVPVFYLGKQGDQPLFLNRGVYFQGKDGKPVISPKGVEPTIPMFFSAKDAQDLLELIKKNQPNAKLDVQVLGLFQLVELMQDDKNNQLAQAITFIPDDDTLQLVAKLQQTLPPNFFKSKPAPAPATSAPSEPTPPAATPQP